MALCYSVVVLIQKLINDQSLTKAESVLGYRREVFLKGLKYFTPNVVFPSENISANKSLLI